jgi:hypothetical protein
MCSADRDEGHRCDDLLSYLMLLFEHRGGHCRRRRQSPLGALEPRDAGAPGRVRSCQAQLAQPLRNAEGKWVRWPHDLPEAGAQGEARGQDQAGTLRMQRAAQRSRHQRPPRLAALEELDQIALFTW